MRRERRFVTTGGGGAVRLAAALCGLAATACSGEGGAALDEGADEAPRGPDAGGANDGGGAGAGGGGPAEREFEAKFQAPVATGRYVWVANPASDRVAYVDALSLRVNLAEAGHAPTHLAAVPSADGDVALVLNVLSRDATLLRARAPGVLEAERLPVPSPANAWGVSPDGRWAIAWTDGSKLDAPDPVDGFQSVTVLGLGASPKTSTELSVGYRPSAVAFDDGARRAFVVTRDGVTVIALGAGPSVERNVPLARGGAAAVEVVVTPDGGYALARSGGEASVRVVPLAGGEATEVPLPAEATDLDLAPGGAAGLAVLRDAGKVALLPLPAVASDPAAVRLLDLGEGAGAGSVALAPTGGAGFFYTNATPSGALTVVDAAAAEPAARMLSLRAPVGAVFPAEGAAHALVLHDAPPPGASAGAPSKYAAAMSLVTADGSAPPKIVGLDRPPAAVALAPGGAHALVATGDAPAAGAAGAGPYALYVADFPSLRVRTFPLASAPTAAGVVAGAGRGYVAQRHPDGRITFIDFATGEVRTLTGFELAAGVVDGGRP
jgi:DNA-binding beta-propeller fold protein YncE